MAAELRSALRLPEVAIHPATPSLTPVHVGRAVAGTVEVPISAHGQRIGVLSVGRRHPGERFRAEEQSVLLEVARRAGTLLQAAQLIAELQHSRERIVIAREEERRRLRADLHDGVGPQLAGLALQLDSLQRRVPADAETTARVQLLRDRLRDAVVEVRRVVDDLRPPALDDVGLVEAVRRQVAAFSLVGAVGGGASTDLPLVHVEPTSALPDLPAAVEVAAYRIVTEAVTNAVRHGRPTRCTVRIGARDGRLVLEVVDDGAGVAVDAAPGVGLASMAERSAELGGTFSVTSGTVGTVVRAELPLAAS
jgi:signal transduction histidine kinase